MMPRTALALVILLLAPRAQREPEWTTPGGDPGGRRFSALTQITRENVSTLQQAWSFDTGATNLQGTPTVAGGLMYVTGGRSVFGAGSRPCNIWIDESAHWRCGHPAVGVCLGLP